MALKSNRLRLLIWSVQRLILSGLRKSWLLSVLLCVTYCILYCFYRFAEYVWTCFQPFKRQRRDKANLKRSNDSKLASSLREKTGGFFLLFFPYLVALKRTFKKSIYPSSYKRGSLTMTTMSMDASISLTSWFHPTSEFCLAKEYMIIEYILYITQSLVPKSKVCTPIQTTNPPSQPVCLFVPACLGWVFGCGYVTPVGAAIAVTGTLGWVKICQGTRPTHRAAGANRHFV